MTVAGRTVLITRALEDAGPWVAAVEARGGRALVRPCIATEDVDPAEAGPALRAALDGADWVAFTSRRAVDAAAVALAGALPHDVRVAVVGGRTGAAVEERFERGVDRVGEEGARQLAATLLETSPAPRAVAFPAAEGARPDLEQVLGAAGVEVRRVTLYRTVTPTEPIDLVALGVDVVLLASPSAAEGLAGRAGMPPAVAVISIGPTTTRAAQALGLTVTAEAASPNLEALLDAVP